MFKLSIPISFIIFLSSANAGTWTRNSSDTLEFQGKIESDEYTKFKAVFDKSIRVLVVNSGGGETSAAMKIGHDLHEAGIEIRVHKWCLSSCANYLFLGASKRIIEKGIVGYHGNVRACFGGSKWPETVEELKKQGLSDEEIEAFHKSTLAQISFEENFLEMVGVSQELFDQSCKPDKGLNDGKEYAFLLPTHPTFEKFGVVNVEGEQDLKTIEEFPGLLAIQ